jgi:hypothetical protein
LPSAHGADLKDTADARDPRPDARGDDDATAAQTPGRDDAADELRVGRTACVEADGVPA